MTRVKTGVCCLHVARLYGTITFGIISKYGNNEEARYESRRQDNLHVVAQYSVPDDRVQEKVRLVSEVWADKFGLVPARDHFGAVL